MTPPPVERATSTGTPARVIAAGLLIIAQAVPALAQDPPPPPGWYSTSGLSYVMAGGNSRASTLGLKVEVKRLWSEATLTIGGTAVRSDASDPARHAIGTADSFEVEPGERVLKAAKYTAATAYDRKVSERFGWQVGLEADRDRFSGLRGRGLALAGASYLVASRKELTLKTGLAATVAHQSEVINDPETRDTFVGVRLSADAERKFGEQSTWVSGLAIDESLQDTSDLRVRFANTLGVSMSRRLALQVGLQLLYDHQPALAELPLFALDGTPTGLTVPGRAATLDTSFTVSVVVRFAPRGATP